MTHSLTELLYLALAEPIGLLVKTEDFEGLRQRLYRARAQAQDEALAKLQFRASPFPEGNLVITKSIVQSVPLGAGPEPNPALPGPSPKSPEECDL